MKLPSPIMNFIIASAVIHVGLLIMQNSINITLPGSSGSVMAIKLKETNQITVTAVKKENSTEKTTNQKTAKIKKNAKQFQPEKLTAKKLIQEKRLATVEDNSVDEQNKSKAHVISILIKEFSQHFSYPKLAIKRNWQGKVLLSLRISSNGIIENITVDNSSGYNILDQAAIDSMRKVKSLPQISSLPNNNIELKLPVIYRLSES